MALTRQEKTGLKIAGVGLIGVGAAAYAWFKFGVGKDQNSLLTPDVLEDRLDALVDKLNQRYGKKWVGIGIESLKTALEMVLPAPAVALVEFVHEAEQQGLSQGWNGVKKKRYAADQYLRRKQRR